MIPETLVTVVRSLRADYGLLPEPQAAPELPDQNIQTVAQRAIRDLFQRWGLDRTRQGTSAWSPLGAFIAPGSRVVLKPNWVLHHNQSGRGMDCLITHTSVLEAVLEYVVLARPSSVIVGDAPVQGCDFDRLRDTCRLDALVERFRRQGFDLRICDFRRTLLPGGNLGAPRIENGREKADYVLFDLARDSLLEPLATEAGKFRVTMYNPDLLSSTHAPGRHRYLIARELMQADVVINLPKLKCHKKTCVTGALKNLVGINGNKEYLPHHRKGGEALGGDCYPGNSWLKSSAENFLDAANRRLPGKVQAGLAQLAQVAVRCAAALGSDENLEGSWFGNDTIWRTCLDLQRVLLYGNEDGFLQPAPQRQVVTITDAIIAGEGEGPLAPEPVPAGFVTGARNPVAADWVHARLMGFDPSKIPLIDRAFADFSNRLAAFPSLAIQVRLPEGDRSAAELFPFAGTSFRPPAGWAGHCELEHS